MLTTWVLIAAARAGWSLGQRRGPVGPPTRVRVWAADTVVLASRIMGGGRVERRWGGAYAPL